MDRFKKYISENKPPPFSPRPLYVAEADSVLFFIDDSDYFAQRVDELLTVFLRVEGESLVGLEVKGVKHLLSKLPSFGVTVSSENVDIQLIFAAYLLNKRLDAENVHYFDDLMKMRNPYETRVSIPV